MSKSLDSKLRHWARTHPCLARLPVKKIKIISVTKLNYLISKRTQTELGKQYG